MKTILSKVVLILFAVIILACSKNNRTTAVETIVESVIDTDRDTPSDNFDLSTWYLSIPDNNGSGKSTSIYESELNNGYENADYFYTGERWWYGF